MHNIFRVHLVLDSYLAKYYNCYCTPHLLRNMLFSKKELFNSMICRWLQLKINGSNYLDFARFHAIRPVCWWRQNIILENLDLEPWTADRPLCSTDQHWTVDSISISS